MADIYGTSGIDNLPGTNAADNIFGYSQAGGPGSDTGADTLSGLDGDDSLTGDGGNDTLSGDGGNDSLSGGDGDDTLISSSGIDELDGGAGDDTFVVRGGQVTITDASGHDTLDASGATGNSTIDLSGASASTVQGEAVVLGTGPMAVDIQFLQDLSGSFADTVGQLAATAVDIVTEIGAVAADLRFGVSSFVDKPINPFGIGSDYVYRTDLALTGDTSVLASQYGGLQGRSGNDGPEAQIEALMQLALRPGEVGFRSGTMRYAVLFTDTRFHIAGDGAAAGIITPNDGNAILDGTPPGTGEDYPTFTQLRTALEAAGIIPIFATSGDLSSYQSLVSTLGRGVALQLNASNGANIVDAITGAQPSVTAVEDALGGAGSDQLTGNGLANMLDGGQGNDTLIGGLGDDTLVGGAGADAMSGGLGNDIFAVDDAGDAVSDSGGIDTVRSGIGFVLAPEIENLTLTGSASIDGAGNRFANTIKGNSAANVLNGNGGSDSMAGGGGDDTYFTDNTGDTAVELAGEGYDTLRSTVSFTLGAEIERLVLRGAAGIDGKGNGLDNDIWGNAGANRLEGGLGDDRLNGGAGIDRLIGGDGDDVFVTDTARDIVVEFAGEGTDRIESLVSKALVANVENLALRGTARINGFGNELANAITGNGQANYLDGKEGSDTLTGGAGRDSFAFTSALGASNIDTISDFLAVDDTIRLDDAIFTNLGGLRWLAADAFHAGAAANDASDRIIYNSATGALFYDADGVGGAVQALFANIAAGLAISNMDFYVM